MEIWRGAQREVNPLVTRKDVEKFRDMLKTGEKIDIIILNTDVEAGGRYPVIKKRLPITYISQWIVVVEDPETGKKHSEQIKQILIDRKTKKSKKMNQILPFLRLEGEAK